MKLQAGDGFKASWASSQALPGSPQCCSCPKPTPSSPFVRAPGNSPRRPAMYTTAAPNSSKRISQPSTKTITTLWRPQVLFFHEPIVSILCVYLSIVFGTLYALFGAYPVIYQQRDWGEYIGGLAFFGVSVGTSCALIYSILENMWCLKVSKIYAGRAPPEARLGRWRFRSIFSGLRERIVPVCIGL